MQKEINRFSVINHSTKAATKNKTINIAALKINGKSDTINGNKIIDTATITEITMPIKYMIAKNARITPIILFSLVALFLYQKRKVVNKNRG